MLARLVVLGLLLRRAMTGYEVQRLLELNQMEQWAGILPGSIYHALKKLEREGLITLRAVEATGNRTRAIYVITPAGAVEFRRLLGEAFRVSAPHYPASVYAALSFVDELPREEVVRLLDEQIAALEGQLVTWNEGERAKAAVMPDVPMPGYLTAIFANGREHMELDLRFLRHLRDTLPAEPPLALEIPALPDEEEEQ
jgi:DNA-binding PadR family transcriptional regulator